MSQTKTAQTKKKNTPVAAPKPSANKKAATSKTSRITHLTAPQSDAVGETSTASHIEALAMLEAPDAAVTPSDDANDAVAYQGEMDAHVEPEPEVAVGQEDVEPSSTTPSIDEIAVLLESASDTIGEDINVDAATDEAPLTSTDVPIEIVEMTAASEVAATSEDGEPTPNTALVTNLIEGDKTPAKKAKGIDRQLRAVSPRYAAACAEVGRLRKDFIQALNNKAQILGVKRVGEAVPVRNKEIDAIDAQIRETRQRLEYLIQSKRQIRSSSPELNAVNQTIRELSRKRQVARLEKKAAYEEAATAKQSAMESELSTV